MKVSFEKRGDAVMMVAEMDGGKTVASRKVTDGDKWRNKAAWQAYLAEQGENPVAGEPATVAVDKPDVKPKPNRDRKGA